VLDTKYKFNFPLKQLPHLSLWGTCS